MQSTPQRQQRTLRLTEIRQERGQEDQEHRDQVIAEFDGDPNAMADEILRYRHSLALVARAIDWVRRGAPFGIINPGPHWRPAGQRDVPNFQPSIRREADWARRHAGHR
jgi:hypothetical protein